MGQVKVNEAYELYQIITDFADPLEIFREGIQNAFDADAKEIFVRVYEREDLKGGKVIIDIANNGDGLPRNQIGNFFNVADSTKVDGKFIPKKSMHGYKGHGAKVFFNAEEIVICSKLKDDYWAANMKDPIGQIEKNKCLKYSDIEDNPLSLDIEIPSNWETGFFVRIISPKAFETKTKRKNLNHMILRDYCKWFTIIGTIETLHNDSLKDKGIKLYLSGMNMDTFQAEYDSIFKCDPVPTFKNTVFGECEEIPLGHYFPEKRSTKVEMKKYSDSIKSTYPYYHYYSNIIYDSVIDAGSFKFRFVISLEGYETKRRYDLLLTRRGKGKTNTGVEGHTDSIRYGLWACKGGVPIERVDDWIIGGKGTYTYMQAFIDYDGFNLTANRGSVQNTDIDTLEIIKQKVNEVWSSSGIQNKIRERSTFEEEAKIDISVKTEIEGLKRRYDKSKGRENITFEDGSTCYVPSKNKSGLYSESETFALLLKIMEKYPNVLPFTLLDYNTTKGIDFVVEDSSKQPKYVELKGSLTNRMNHPFECIHAIICYDLSVDVVRIEGGLEGQYVIDLQNEAAKLSATNSKYKDPFDSSGANEVPYTMYRLAPNNPNFTSINVYCLRTFLTEVLKATIK